MCLLVSAVVFVLLMCCLMCCFVVVCFKFGSLDLSCCGLVLLFCLLIRVRLLLVV